MQPARLILPVLLFALLGCGCAPVVRGEQPARSEFTRLPAGETLGQSFVARYAGLSGFELYLDPEESGSTRLVLHLSEGSGSGSELGTSELPLSSSDSPGYYRFQLPPQSTSKGRDYFALVELDGPGSVGVGSAPGDAYLNGAQYRNQQAQDAQLAFRLVYDPRLALGGLFVEGLGWLFQLAAAGFLFVIPGWALLGWLLPGWWSLSWGEKLGLGIGTSLALYPLLFLWTDLASLHLGAAYAWGLPLLGAGLLVYSYLRAGPPQRPFSRRRIRHFLTRMKGGGPADLALLLLVALIFATRFWVIRGLDVPLWGDSYQHTLITQLLVDHGGLFTSWQPYAELQTFTYHFGFHSFAALFHWITRLPMLQTVLWTGQILNGLAVLAIYPLAVHLGRSRWAGVAAVLVAGLLVQMPMFYVNWGRYTELAGLAILPAVAVIVDRLLAIPRDGGFPFERGSLSHQPAGKPVLRGRQGNPEKRPNRWLQFSQSDLFKTLLLAWIVLSGLALTHYRVTFFAGFFLPAALLFHLWPGRARLAVIKVLAAGAGAGILFLPWFIRLLSGRLLQVFGGLVTTPAGQVEESVAQYNVIGDLNAYLPVWIWVLMLLALAFGFWRRERGAALVFLWWLLVLLAANPHWLGLPGTGVLSNFAVFIAAYLPAGILLGAAAGWAREWFASTGWKERLGRTNGREPGAPGLSAGWLALLFVLALGVWGARQRAREVDAGQYALATRADLRAAAWVQANTPRSALFLVDSFLAYGDTLVAGSDGGWWLPLLAGRKTTLPPINYSSEQGPRPDYLAWTNALTVALQDYGIDDPRAIQLLKERGITHVYIGQQLGRVGNPGPSLLQVETISASPYFRTIYHQDRVWIFAFVE